jgi:hypothetical protein
MNLKVGRASRSAPVGEADGKFAFPFALSRSLGPLQFMVPMHVKEKWRLSINLRVLPASCRQD